MITVDATKETYELITLEKEEVLFTNSRVDRETIPKDLFCYDIRHGDEDAGEAHELARHVRVNFMGTVISKKEIPLDYHDVFHPIEDMNFLGEHLTLAEYQSR